MTSFTDQRGASLSYVERGEGAAVLALHGAYSTHAEMEAILEPILEPLGAHRRIYPDLPGMGDSQAHDTIRSSADVVSLLEELVDEIVGASPLIVVGHSYGGHIARGLAARRPEQVAGLVLICPLVPDMRGEDHAVVVAQEGASDLVAEERRDDFLGYFVIHTADTARRFDEAVVPSIGRFDPDGVERIMRASELTPDPDVSAFNGPVLVWLGRSDSFVGYRTPLDLAQLVGASTLTIHEMPKRSVHIPNFGDQNVSPSGMVVCPPSASPANTRSASAASGVVNVIARPFAGPPSPVGSSDAISI